MKCGHFNGAPERRLGESDRHFAEDVIPLEPEEFVFLGVDDDKEIARRRAWLPGLSLPSQAKARAGSDPGWYRDGQRASLGLITRTSARGTRRGDYLTTTAARRARLGQNKERALSAGYVARSFALKTLLRAGSGSGATAGATLTRNQGWQT